MQIFTALVVSGLLSVGTTGGTWLRGADPHQDIPGLPGQEGWPAAVAAAAPGVRAPDPASASPAEMRRFFAGLSPAQGRELVRRAPAVVGNLDGAPPRLRYAAHRLAGRTPPAGARLMGYDSRGDGRVIIAFGDLAAARHIAVIVPGSGWTLDTVLANSGQHTDPIDSARALRAAVRQLDPAASVAVVVWLGYDAPEQVDRQAMRSERAIAGGPALGRFVDGLAPSAHVSVICHSYGAVVCGRAASPRVSDLVAVAAPGMDVSSAAELRPRRVWAGRTADDPIRFVPDVRIGGYGHGADPVDASFGAEVFRTGAARGHDHYFAPGTESLTNIARIVLDRAAEVTRVD